MLVCEGGTMFRSAVISLAASASAVWVSGVDAAGSPQSVKEQYQLEEASTPVRERAGWKKPKRILLVGVGAEAIEHLKGAAPDVELVRAGNAIEAQSLAANVDAVIGAGACTPGILAAGKSIRWVQVLSAGVEECVAIPAIQQRDILVTNMQRIMGPVIAEHVTAMMLALTRGLNAFIPAQRERAWKRDAAAGRMAVVEGKTMLVVGLGGIGTEIAKRAHALGMRVIATRASGRTGPDFVSYVGLPDELLKLASEADVVVNATPLTPQTTDLFDAAFFARMKPAAYFINIGRGKSVVTAALVEALENGKIAGAGLDVTEPEPLPPDHALWTFSNVVITPHVAANSDLGSAAQMEVVKENVRRYTAGERMLSVVDVGRGY
jgi:phosphoglycerate dehydrogenase-like enzyme